MIALKSFAPLCPHCNPLSKEVLVHFS